MDEVERTEPPRKLHHILQAAFGWEDTHLHDFLIDGMTYAMFEVDVPNPRATTFQLCLDATLQLCSYKFNFDNSRYVKLMARV